MTNLIERIRKAPDRLDEKVFEKWLKNIPAIKNFAELDYYFSGHDLDADGWKTLINIINEKYVNETEAKTDFGGSYEKALNENLVTDSNRIIYFQEDKSKVLDLSNLKKALEKVNVSMMRPCSEILFPNSKNLEMISVGFLPRLEKVDNLSTLSNLRYLSIDKCNNFTGWDDISNLKNLSYLSLSDNVKLPELSFLDSKLPIVILHLSSTNAMKLRNTIEYLSRLKRLRYLTIQATKNELQALREMLPFCYVNGALFSDRK